MRLHARVCVPVPLDQLFPPLHEQVFFSTDRDTRRLLFSQLSGLSRLVVCCFECLDGIFSSSSLLCCSCCKQRTFFSVNLRVSPHLLMDAVVCVCVCLFLSFSLVIVSWCVVRDAHPRLSVLSSLFLCSPSFLLPVFSNLPSLLFLLLSLPFLSVLMVEPFSLAATATLLMYHVFFFSGLCTLCFFPRPSSPFPA